MKRFWGMLTVMVLAAGLAGVCPAQWIVDGATWPDGGGGFSPAEEDDPCAGCVSTNHTGDVSIDGDLSLTGGLTLGGERRETWPAAGGGTGEVAFAESNRLWVDWRNDSGTEDGSVYRPFSSVQAALDGIGSVDDMLDLTNAASRYVVHVAPGVYAGDVTVPYQRDIVIELDSALIEGDLVWTVYNASAAAWLESGEGLLIPRLTIAGRSWKPHQPAHANTGIAGAVRVAYGGTNPSAHGKPDFAALNLFRVRADTVTATNAPHAAWLLVSLSEAGVGEIHAQGASHSGILLYAHGWDGGGLGSDNYAERGGIGPLTGQVYPLTLNDVLLAGMAIEGVKPAGHAFGVWHNVYFRPDWRDGADSYVIDTDLPVRLDAATYNRWLAATGGVGSDRGSWHVNGGIMTLEDPAAHGPWYTGTDVPTDYLPLYIGQSLVVTGTPRRVYAAFGDSTNDWIAVWADE